MLAAAGLPLAGFADHLSTALVVIANGEIVGCVALEVYGREALLRSLVVAPAARGRGFADELVRRILAIARQRGVGRVWLLTTTASEYFGRRSFSLVAREQLPEALQASAELRGACPASAVAMVLELTAAGRP